MDEKFNYGANRAITNIYEAEYLPYDMDGPLQENMSYIPLTYDKAKDGLGVYMIKMEPGSETIAHTHQKNEDYLILEGELIEADGTILRKGDFVHYEPGTYHNSRTESGCLLIGVDWVNKDQS